MLKITGKQFASGDEDRIEFITAGTISTEGKTAYISYEETPISGMEGCTTNLTVSNGKVTMSRSGDSLDETVMEFEKGRRYRGLYATPYGNIAMELLTNDVKGDILSLLEEKTGSLSIDYDISLKGIAQSRNTLDIEILGEVQ